MNKTILIGMVADIHCDYDFMLKLALETRGCDVIFVAGDLTSKGTKSEVENVLEILNAMGVPIIITPGNHDTILECDRYVKKLHDKYENIRILVNETIDFNGFIIYGTPYTKEFCDWSFQYSNEDEMKKFLPDYDVDILLTHSNPSCEIIDHIESEDIHIGSSAITDYLNKYNVMINISGHNHHMPGECEYVNNTLCYNVAKAVRMMYLKKVV
jgi:Icc-related predicted phosphoesterase